MVCTSLFVVCVTLGVDAVTRGSTTRMLYESSVRKVSPARTSSTSLRARSPCVSPSARKHSARVLSACPIAPRPACFCREFSKRRKQEEKIKVKMFRRDIRHGRTAAAEVIRRGAMGKNEAKRKSTKILKSQRIDFLRCIHVSCQGEVSVLRLILLSG